MPNRISTLLTAAAALSLLTAGAAQAQTSHKAAPLKVRTAKVAHHPVVIAEMSDALARKPLVIQKRSFLDPGNVVQVGADTPVDVVYNTTEYRPVYTSYAPAFFGTSELPGRFDLPPTNPRFNPSVEPHIPLPFE